jgi:hypothetical protein
MLWRRFLMHFLADELGTGSTQATVDPSDAGADQPFWDALNLHVKNLHAVISGHGKSRRARSLHNFEVSRLDVQITETSGAHENRRRMSCFASTSIQGSFRFFTNGTLRVDRLTRLCADMADTREMDGDTACGTSYSNPPIRALA